MGAVQQQGPVLRNVLGPGEIRDFVIYLEERKVRRIASAHFDIRSLG